MTAYKKEEKIIEITGMSILALVIAVVSLSVLGRLGHCGAGQVHADQDQG